VFGISFTELLVVVIVGLIVLGPQKLPGLFRTIGHWIGQLRRFSTEVRAQSGIDELLRAEGLHGGLNELRGILRTEHHPPVDLVSEHAAPNPYTQNFGYDDSRERPVEGPDSFDAIADDLTDSIEEAPSHTP
jgi:Tat protein translocase TatB subunit